MVKRRIRAACKVRHPHASLWTNPSFPLSDFTGISSKAEDIHIEPGLFHSPLHHSQLSCSPKVATPIRLLGLLFPLFLESDQAECGD